MTASCVVASDVPCFPQEFAKLIEQQWTMHLQLQVIKHLLDFVAFSPV